jgi:hypothetical protein
VTKDEATLFVDSRYVEAAEKAVTDCNVLLFKKASEDIKNYLKEKSVVKAYTERNHISVSTADFLKTAFLPCRVTPSKKLEKAIDESRITKTDYEIESIKAAQKIAEDAFANVIDVVIQCSRGSFASAYRIRNKIRGEYISKTKDTTNKETHTDRKSRKHINDGLSALSEEEYRVIMEMRREKLLQKKVVDSNCKCQERTEYRQVPFDSQKVSLRIQEDSRKITNNIFNIKFFQNKGVDTETEASQYETFVIDDLGQVISTVVGIDASKSGDDLTHKATYTLSAQEKFDKNKDYYIVLRYKGAENEIVSKTKYKIVIEFASDFDF